MIACVRILYFASLLETADQPLLLTTTDKKRVKIMALCPQAEAAGVRVGMTLRRASALCPQAEIRPAPLNRLRRFSDSLLELLSTFSDRLELCTEVFPHTALIWLDFGRLRVEEGRRLGQRLLATLHQVMQLEGALGLAAGKFPAQVAATTGAIGQIQLVAADTEAAFLATLPLKRLTLNRKLLRQLGLLGITTLGQFARLPASTVFTRFGGQAQWLHQLARGEDPRRINVYKRRETVCAGQTFEDGVVDRQIVQAILYDLSAQLATCLQPRGLGSRSVTLLLHLADGTTCERQQICRETVNQTFSIAQACSRLLRGVSIHAPVVGIEIQLDEVTSVQPRQLELFAAPGCTVADVLHELAPRHGLEGFYRLPVEITPSLLLEERAPLESAAFA